MNDYIVRATAAGDTVRAFAIRSTDLTAEAREIHHTFPVVTAALGRLLSAGAMMGAMMKGEDDKLTLQMKGDGPIAQMTVTADSHGNVKGFAANPAVDIPLKRAGKLATISTEDIKEMINDGEEIEVKCYFCNSAYKFSVDELEDIIASR